jgi:hypothetical protein
MTATVHAMKKSDDFDGTHETLTVPQFAKRIHRDRQTVYWWIRNKKMPPGTVLSVQGHLEIDWTVYQQSIRKVG